MDESHPTPIGQPSPFNTNKVLITVLAAIALFVGGIFTAVYLGSGLASWLTGTNTQQSQDPQAAESSDELDASHTQSAQSGGTHSVQSGVQQEAPLDFFFFKDAILDVPLEAVKDLNGDIVGDATPGQAADSTPRRFTNGVYMAPGDDYDMLEIVEIKPIQWGKEQAAVVHVVRAFDRWPDSRSFLLIYSRDLKLMGRLVQMGPEMNAAVPLVASGSEFVNLEVKGTQVSFDIERIPLMEPSPCTECRTSLHIESRWDGEYLTVEDYQMITNGFRYRLPTTIDVQRVVTAISEYNDDYARQFFTEDAWPDLETPAHPASGDGHRQILFRPGAKVNTCVLVMTPEDALYSISSPDPGDMICDVVAPGGGTYALMHVRPTGVSTFKIIDFSPMYD